VIFRQNLDTINRLLRETADDPDRGIKSYCVGLVSALAEGDGIIAPDAVLEAAASCKTIAAAVRLYTTCKELRVGAEPDTPESAAEKARTAGGVGRLFKARGRTDREK
jgi:hypothetical protein